MILSDFRYMERVPPAFERGPRSGAGLSSVATQVG